MKIFKKKETVIPMDEEGNPIEKKFDWKDLGKKVLFGLVCMGAGALAFIAVGVAMTGSDEESSGDESTDTETSAETSSDSESSEN